MWEEIENVAKKEREERCVDALRHSLILKLIFDATPHRYKPRRQRTKPVDVRPSRTNLGMNERESVDLGQATSILSQQHAQTQIQQVLPPTPPAPELPRKESTLPKIETQTLAPPVPIVQSGEEYAASPMESNSAFPAEDEKEPGRKKKELDVEDEKPSSLPSSTLEGATETPFSPPTSSEVVTEEPFVPPTSSFPSSSDNLPSISNSNETEDKPLSSSTSLKRQSGSARTGEGATGGGSGSGRLRGARAPRPISHSHSNSGSGSVFDKVKAFEGGK